MKKNFTDDEIIRFLYDEMTSDESHEFLDALCVDEKLWERYEYFQEIVEKLTDLKYEPSQLSIDKVKAYIQEGRIAKAPQLHEVNESPVTASSLSVGKILSVSVNLNAVVLMAVILFVSVAVTGTFLQLKRSLPNLNRPAAIVQNEIEPQFQWDDSYLDDKLDRIREKVQDLKE